MCNTIIILKVAARSNN